MKRKIILLGLTFLLSSCVFQGWGEPSTSHVSSIKPTAYPLPNETNFNRKIAYIDDFESVVNLFSINSDGSNKTKLSFVTNSAGYLVHYLAITPDGSKVIFTSDQENGSLFQINIDGTNKKEIFPSGQLFGINLSRDGKMLVASLDKKIYVYNLKTGEKKDTGISGEYPDISPDNKKIVFKDYRLYIANLDGSESKLIINDRNDYNYPRWSPDGVKIFANCGNTENKISGICSINTDGSDLKVIIDKVDNVAISHDGTKIAYTDIFNLYIANIDGSNVKKILSGDNKEHIENIRWSPDSKKLAFIKAMQVSVIDADGNNLKALTNKSIGIPDVNPGTYSFVLGALNLAW